MSRALRVVLPALLIATGVSWSQTPPADLRLVGDHWTPWNPPLELPEGADVHVIVRDDTLWDLAENLLGDPYLWPQIWERNQYILDAHWIYPGDPLILGLRMTTPEEEVEVVPELVTEVTPEPEPEVDATFVPSPRGYPLVQLGHADDIACSGFIGGLDETFPRVVTGSEYEFLAPAFDINRRGRLQAEFGTVDTIKFGLSKGDIVYLDGGRAGGLVPGQTFTAISPGAVVRHPRTDKRLGRYYEYLGQIRVLTVHADAAIGEIMQSCDFINVGTRLAPLQSIPIPSRRKGPMRPASYPPSREALEKAAIIVHAKDGLVVMGQDHVVFINRGDDRGLEAGDLLTVYRIPPHGPPIVLGEIAVLLVRENTSVAKVVASRHPIYVGDVAELN